MAEAAFRSLLHRVTSPEHQAPDPGEAEQEMGGDRGRHRLHQAGREGEPDHPERQLLQGDGVEAEAGPGEDHHQGDHPAARQQQVTQRGPVSRSPCD